MIVMKADEDVPLWSLSPSCHTANEASVRGSNSVPGMCDRGRWPPFRTLPVYYYLQVADKMDGGTHSPCLAWLFVWGGPGWYGGRVRTEQRYSVLGQGFSWTSARSAMSPFSPPTSFPRPPRRKRHSVQVLLNPHRCSMQLLQHPLSLVWVADHPSPTGRRPFTPSFPSTVFCQHSPDAEHTNP